MRILLVEDDELLGDGIRHGLTCYKHLVDWIKDGKTALHAITAQSDAFDVIVLDLGLPELSGLELLTLIRKNNILTPVVILTARGEIENRVKGLDAGADDYLTKPFDLDELCARLRALQRRSQSRANPLLLHMGIVLDPANRTVTFNKEPIELTRREFTLLQKLLEYPGRVISREAINQALYSWSEHIDSNALEVHIHNLRKRFGAQMIRTVRGVGYMIISDTRK